MRLKEWEVRSKNYTCTIRILSDFWPNGLGYQNDSQEHLLTQFPVPKKGYFTVLFNEVIKPFFKTEEELKIYLEIVETFNKKN